MDDTGIPLPQLHIHVSHVGRTRLKPCRRPAPCRAPIMSSGYLNSSTQKETQWRTCSFRKVPCRLWAVCSRTPWFLQADPSLAFALPRVRVGWLRGCRSGLFIFGDVVWKYEGLVFESFVEILLLTDGSFSPPP